MEETIDERLQRQAERLKPLLFKVGKAFSGSETVKENDVSVSVMKTDHAVLHEDDGIARLVLTAPNAFVFDGRLQEAFPQHAGQDFSPLGVQLDSIERTNQEMDGHSTFEFRGEKEKVAGFLDQYIEAFRREERAIDQEAGKGTAKG